MEARSTDKRTFQLTDEGQLLGELVYENIFFLKAGLTVGNSDQYEVRPVGFFGTSITVMKNGSEIASLVMNWRGQIVFSFREGGEFVLKAKGLFNNKFIIENREEEILIQYDPKFNWSKFNYSYEITYEKKPKDILLVLLGIYAANYFVVTMTGASSGMA